MRAGYSLEDEFDQGGGTGLARETERILFVSQRFSIASQNVQRDGSRVETLNDSLFVSSLLLQLQGTLIKRYCLIGVTVNAIKTPQARQNSR